MGAISEMKFPAIDWSGFLRIIFPKTTLPKEASDSSWYRHPPTPFSWTPRVASMQDYPLDLDASERFARPRTGWDYKPDPYVQNTAWTGPQYMGWVKGVSPMVTGFVESQMIGKNPTGPNVLWWNPYSNSYGVTALPQARKQG